MLVWAMGVRLAGGGVVGGGVNGDNDRAVGVGGSARSGVVGEEILGAQLAVDAIEDGSKFLGRVGIEHGAAGGVGHGFQGMLTSGVAAAFIFHWSDDDGVKKRVGKHGFLAGRLEVSATGRLARVSNQVDNAA